MSVKKITSFILLFCGVSDSIHARASGSVEHALAGEETHHLVEIYVIADKAVDFIGDVRKLHLSGCHTYS